MIRLADLAPGDPVELEAVATGTVWFVTTHSPYRVSLGIFRTDGREWAGWLDPHAIDVTETDGRYVITHTDPT